ncbi:MAG: NAD-glutamate dehydrogenase [Planctomycetes bacterium]|nr:NAD-glutamate dehydrogenase [Planctomycetota bacterium]
MVYIPREKYSTAIRHRVEKILMEAFGGISVDSSVQITDSPLARVHLIVRTAPGDRPRISIRDIEQEIADAVSHLGVDLFGDGRAQAQQELVHVLRVSDSVASQEAGVEECILQREGVGLGPGQPRQLQLFRQHAVAEAIDGGRKFVGDAGVDRVVVIVSVRGERTCVASAQQRGQELTVGNRLHFRADNFSRGLKQFFITPRRIVIRQETCQTIVFTNEQRVHRGESRLFVGPHVARHKERGGRSARVGQACRVEGQHLPGASFHPAAVAQVSQGRLPQRVGTVHVRGVDVAGDGVLLLARIGTARACPGGECRSLERNQRGHGIAGRDGDRREFGERRTRVHQRNVMVQELPPLPQHVAEPTTAGIELVVRIKKCVADLTWIGRERVAAGPTVEGLARAIARIVGATVELSFRHAEQRRIDCPPLVVRQVVSRAVDRAYVDHGLSDRQLPPCQEGTERQQSAEVFKMCHDGCPPILCPEGRTKAATNCRRPQDPSSG